MEQKKFILRIKNKRPLSYFFPNGNGKVKDIIGFSYNNYFIFSSEREAEEKRQSMKKALYEKEMEIYCWLKICKIIDKLKVERIYN